MKQPVLACPRCGVPMAQTGDSCGQALAKNYVSFGREDKPYGLGVHWIGARCMLCGYEVGGSCLHMKGWFYVHFGSSTVINKGKDFALEGARL